VTFPPPVRSAWRYLLSGWSDSDDSDIGWYKLREALTAEGWTSWGLREYERLCQPRFEVTPHRWQVAPFANADDYSVADLLEIDVHYMEHLRDIPVPDAQLSGAVRAVGNAVESAVRLESELNVYGLVLYHPLLSKNEDERDRVEGLHSLVVTLCDLLKRFAATAQEDARKEWTRVSQRGDPVSSRMRIWGLAMSDLVPAEAMGELLDSLSDDVFWDANHQADLLLAVQVRYGSMPAREQERLNRRLITLPAIASGAADDAQKSFAWMALSRVQWLEDHGCDVPKSLQSEREMLLDLAPEWTKRAALEAADGLSVRSGWVRSDSNCEALEGAPISEVLERAKTISSSQGGDFLVEKDPWGGFATERRVRAFRVLTYHGRRNEFPYSAWTSYLQSERSKNDSAKLTAAIARRLASYQDRALVPLIRAASDWLEQKADALFVKDRDAFYALVDHLSLILRANPELTKSGIVHSEGRRDWAVDALNSPTGSLMRALMKDPTRHASGEPGFSDEWLNRVEALLLLPGEGRLHTLVMVSFNLGYFFWHANNWTIQNVIARLEGSDASAKEAVWAGFLWGARTPGEALYEVMKPHLLAAAVDGSVNRRGSIEAIAGMILAGWGTPRRNFVGGFVADDELRNLLINADSEFRSQVLWIARRWARTAEEKEGHSWRSNLTRLLRDVWPRQLSAKTFVLSERLVDMAFEFPDDFQELSALVLPLVGTIEKEYLHLHDVTQNGPALAAKHPDAVLSLLSTVLPADARSWPYGLDATLGVLGDSRATAADPRFIELRRRLSAR
jgi:hypothetical protein